ncbi:MAG: primosomal protein N', partial [Planctomycetota bacterium]
VSGSGPPRYSVLLAAPPERARAEADGLRKRAVRQARVLDFLAREPGPHPHPLVLKRCGCTLDVLRALARKGFLLLSPVETTAFDLPTGHDPGATPASLTAAQREALEAVNSALDARSFRPFLLHGVTGSGKTEVYLRALSHAVANGGRGIVLVPEIALTPQTVARFQARFPRLAVLHSAMPAGYRRRQWELAAAGKADVVIGARSAVFAPLPSLSLIVVDEEHEPSYKQENPPRYHAREVALMRGRFEDAVVLLGSATPSLESYRNAREGRFTLLRLP